MKIATLQFAPEVGDIEGNIRRADEVLRKGGVFGGDEGADLGVEGGGRLKLDVLVLPELALTGYNFPSLKAIKPYLEPVGQGPSAIWARETAKRLGCKVCIGYPEIGSKDTTHGQGSSDQDVRGYNSLLVVDEKGEVILNYRKAFLYYTDETWAREGKAEDGFHELIFRSPESSSSSALSSAGSGAGTGTNMHASKETAVATSFGICMDINPYRFEAPFEAWEFATRVLDSKSQLVVVSMAWLTLLSREEIDRLADKPELDTFNYWVQRFMPLIRKKMGHDVNADGDERRGKKIIIVFANRAGEEAGAEGATPARYAGTSAIIAVTQRPQTHPGLGNGGSRGDSSDDEVAEEDNTRPFDVKILCWDMLGTTSEGVCFADTTAEPKMVFQLVKASKP